MKARLLTVAALSGTFALTVTGAHAATPTLDGKKVKSLTLVTSSGTQDHDTDLATDVAKNPTGSVDRTQCTAPRCAALTFVYKPARGVKAPIGFAISWTVPGDDMDLYVAEVVHGERSEVAHCGASAGMGESIVLPTGTLVPGHTYALVADFYRSAGDKVTAKVAFPATAPAKTTVPAAVDLVEPVNCGL